MGRGRGRRGGGRGEGGRRGRRGGGEGEGGRGRGGGGEGEEIWQHTIITKIAPSPDPVKASTWNARNRKVARMTGMEALMRSHAKEASQLVGLTPLTNCRCFA